MLIQRVDWSESDGRGMSPGERKKAGRGVMRCSGGNGEASCERSNRQLKPP